VQVNGDSLFESEEGFLIVLSSPTNAVITDDTGIGTILNDDIDDKRVKVDDLITGGATSDRIEGYGGSDRLFGRAGNDVLLGGDGNDTLYGGSGNDRLFGGNNSDRLYGDSGKDVLQSGSGSDQVWGGKQRDLFVLERGWVESSFKILLTDRTSSV
jgi:Ca2+-binding RTX toxin-like protein